MTTIPLVSPKIRTLHAHVMEACMRKPHSHGKTVTMDSVLLNPRSARVQMAAVYWAIPLSDGLPQIHEAHFFLEHDTLVDYTPKTSTRWAQYTWKVSPDGRLVHV